MAMSSWNSSLHAYGMCTCVTSINRVSALPPMRLILYDGQYYKTICTHCLAQAWFWKQSRNA